MSRRNTAQGGVLAAIVCALLTGSAAVAGEPMPILGRLLFGSDQGHGLSDNIGRASAAGAPDRITENCLNCHDGLVSPRLSNHPVGVRYRDALRAEPGEYRALSDIEADSRLVNGRVSCASCHGLKESIGSARERTSPALDPPAVCSASNALVIGVGGRDLCLRCHIK